MTKAAGKTTKNIAKMVVNHLDKDEIIAKLILDFSPKDIHDWLAAKYTNPNESKFVLSEKSIKSFKDNYLDVYNMIQEDILKTKQALATNAEDELDLSIRNNSSYKNKMMELASGEIDVRQMMARLVVNLEERLGQIFDIIQENPRDINTRIDRLLNDYIVTFGNLLEKYYKFTESPNNQVINNNITIQAVDQHISVFYEAIRETLSQIDLETSLYFIETYNKTLQKLKMQAPNAPMTTEMKLAEAKILNETINKKLNE